MSHHRFDGWDVLPHERAVLVKGERARLGGRAFDLLLALVRRQGRVASKSELLDEVWPGLVVEENNLSVQIAALRKLLGPAAIANVSGHGYRLAVQALPDAEHGAAPVQDRATASVLPPLFGRDADLQVLLQLLPQAPVLAVVGTGGVGKTALARALAAASRGRWRDGEHWLDLAPLHDASALRPLLAKSLGVVFGDLGSPDESWLSLRPMQALVVLDNCEHLLDGVAAFVGDALRLAPGLRWLATSQEPLHLPGEHVYRLQPLSVSPSDAEPAAVLGCAAVALLCERVRAADHQFELPPQQLELAADLCRQLDGLPLAIEMAAARVASLGLVDVQRQIGQRLQFRAGRRDVPQRQHTLRQTFEWSYGLLSAAEQRMFRRLAPFTGGFDTTLALRLCCNVTGDAEPLTEWQALDTLASLVDKSLVQRDSKRQRFQFLENARDFARLQLQEVGERDAAREWHAQAMADWSDTATTAYDRLGDDEWAACFLPERHNVRDALGWAIGAGQPDLLARLLAALAQLDVFAQLPSAVHCDVPLGLLHAAAPLLRARACLAFSTAHHIDGDRELGTQLALRALADFESLSDTTGVYGCLARLVRLYEGRPGMRDQARAAWARLQQIDDADVPLRMRLACAATVGIQLNGRSVERLQELQAVALRAGFSGLARACQTTITDQMLVQGRFEEAVQVARAVLQAGDARPRAKALTNHNLALALIQLGRVDEARAAARESLRALPNQTCMIVDLFALVAARGGRCADAALMAGYGAEVKRQRDERPERAEAAVIDETMAHLREGLGADRLAELMRHGALMQRADVLALAFPV